MEEKLNKELDNVATEETTEQETAENENGPDKPEFLNPGTTEEVTKYGYVADRVLLELKATKDKGKSSDGRIERRRVALELYGQEPNVRRVTRDITYYVNGLSGCVETGATFDKTRSIQLAETAVRLAGLLDRLMRPTQYKHQESAALKAAKATAKALLASGADKAVVRETVTSILTAADIDVPSGLVKCGLAD